MTGCRNRFGWARTCVAGLLLLLATGCAYTGGGPDRPLVQKTRWFSYLNGDDIRQTCASEPFSRYRFVYNGQYRRQVRAYEVIDDGAGGAYMISRVQQVATLSRISSADFLAPWRWTTERSELSPAMLESLETALQQSGFFEPAPSGLLLDSRAFYWLAVGCRDRQMYFHAWTYPQTDLPTLPLQAWLLEQDATGVAIATPFRVGPEGRLASSRSNSVDFTLTVGDNGLRGVRTLF